MPVINAWATRAEYTTARPIANQFPGCMDDLTTERSFDSQGTWVIDVLGLSFLRCYPNVFVHPSTADVRPPGAGIAHLYCNIVHK